MPADSSPVGDVGDVRSFEAFYAATAAPMVRLAHLLTGGSADAEDIVQDAFWRVHARWGSVEHPPAYMRRAIVNGAASYRRRLALVSRTRPSTAETAELGVDELRDAVAKLPHRQRAAVVLRYYEDLPEAAIADALGCRVPAVKSLLHRALRDLREVIER